MSFYAWRWSPVEHDFVPECEFLTEQQGNDYIAEVKKRYPDIQYVGRVVEANPADKELFEAYRKARKLLHEWRVRER